MAVDEDRIFVRNLDRHYRRKYSRAEFLNGLGVLAALCVIGLWFLWMGRHPDPELYKASIGLVHRGPETVARGPVPTALLPDSWQENRLARFGPENLYEKINGREGFYKGFGFQQLYALTLTHTSGAQLDIEFFDLGDAQNAQGAFVAERPPEAKTRQDAGGISLVDRNVLYLKRSQYYIRGIGPDETPQTTEALEHLRARLIETMRGSARTWSAELFDKLGFESSDVKFTAKNAFSFEFAKEIYSARKGDLEYYVGRTSAAENTAKQFIEGFEQYGERVPAHPSWVKDRYLDQYASSQSAGEYVFGVKGAATQAAGEAAMVALGAAIKALEN